VAVDAVIFDWGGTLTPWHTSDGRSWWRIAARLVPAEQAEAAGAALAAAEAEVWRRSRDEHRSSTLAEVFAAAGIADHERAYVAHNEEWERSTLLDPDALPLLTGLRERGIRIGVLSNTLWTRQRHEQIFVRDGIADLIDGAVYSCEIPWTKPHPEAFRSAMAAVGCGDAARCVFVGDRPFDDIFGARRAGLRAVLLPHSAIPEVQRGHTEGEPDAVIQRLTDLLPLVDAWRAEPSATASTPRTRTP
jgi:putative hydrolase of the HAD superfamily